MNKTIAASLAVAIALTGCGKSQSKPAAEPQRYSKLPTATEIFNLRTKCAQLAQQLDQRLPYGANWVRVTSSNYNASNNRCYVTLTDMNEKSGAVSNNLYDGQTGELLAYAKHDGPASRPTRQVGQIFIDSKIDTVSDCHEGGDCGFAKVNAFIDERMKRED